MISWFRVKLHRSRCTLCISLLLIIFPLKWKLCLVRLIRARSLISICRLRSRSLIFSWSSPWLFINLIIWVYIIDIYIRTTLLLYRWLRISLTSLRTWSTLIKGSLICWSISNIRSLRASSSKCNVKTCFLCFINIRLFRHKTFLKSRSFNHIFN